MYKKKKMLHVTRHSVCLLWPHTYASCPSSMIRAWDYSDIRQFSRRTRWIVAGQVNSGRRPHFPSSSKFSLHLHLFLFFQFSFLFFSSFQLLLVKFFSFTFSSRLSLEISKSFMHFFSIFPFQLQFLILFIKYVYRVSINLDQVNF